MEGLTKLYRPVGEKEFELIAASGFQAFPPRLEWQPIFYPVLTREYAEHIAQRWNTVDEASGFVGYVLEFDVRAEYLKRFEIQKVGDKTALEYWIPAEELQEFNANIVGPIRKIAKFENTSIEGPGANAGHSN